MENLNLDINLKYIRKTSRKIIKNKYLTYFVALFTIFHISESLINSDNITFVKLLFQNNILKVLVFMLVVIIGYFNMTLGFLLLLNFIFVINIPQKVEGFANSLPNLIDKNELLKYKNNFVSNEPTELKYKSNEEMTKKINEEGEKSKNETNETTEKKIEKEFTKNDKTSKISINNPINLKDSEKLEEITDKMKKNDTDTNTDTDIDEKSSLNLRKQKLREELEKLEKDEKEIKDLKENEDDTIESDIKEKELDKRLRLSAMEEEDDESSSSSSNSSGSSSSSDSSEDSDKDYDEVSINDARDHVMKKLRNKLKRKYVKGK